MNNIPKIIHYCWFGHNLMPIKYKHYINSWKKYCPDFKVIKWSEKNFDYTQNSFTFKAYKQGNWAFISDYVRLYALKIYGGIYLDVDVELIKPLNPLLKNNSFMALENWDSIASGLICGFKQNDDNLINILKIYDSIGNNNGKLNIMDNTVNIITTYFHKIGFKYKNKFQIINNCSIYPTDYFCPLKYGSNKIKITNNTYTIHHYYGSWTNNNENNNKTILHIKEGQIIKRIITPSVYNFLYRRYIKIKKKY